MLFQDFENRLRQICLILGSSVWYREFFGGGAGEFIQVLVQFCRWKTVVLGVVSMAHSWPMETILLSICLEHGKMIEEILGLLKEKKA